MRESVIKIQSNAKKIIAEKSYDKLRNGIIKMQSYARGALARTDLKVTTYSAIIIQCSWRKFNHQQANEWLHAR